MTVQRPAATRHRPTLGRRVLDAFARWPRRLSGPGLAGALVFFTISLGPALLPRAAFYQGAVAGICAAIGYGLGALLAWVVRRAGVPWSRRASRWFRRVLLAATLVAVPAALWWNRTWQDELRGLFGEPPAHSSHPFVVVTLALVLAVLLLQVGRGLRRVTRWVGGLVGRVLGRWVPVPVTRLVAVALVAWLTVVVLDGTVVRGGLAALNGVYSTLDSGTAPGVVQPDDRLRSGSPESSSAWDDLGLQGRTFVAGGRPAAHFEEVAARTGRTEPLQDPIRVYAGLSAGDSLDEVAQLVVAELDRTHAWDRSVLAVVTATGTGWVDPSMSDSLELLWGGDTAIASMQYSYLPSWISFVGDRSTPPAAGKALFEAVYERWSQLPEDDRPLLYAAGISLGSYGSQSAFSSVQDVVARTDGALWVGTPGFTPLWGELTADRDPGSPEITPVLDDGRTVRWANRPADGSDRQLWALGDDWERPRVVYDQHASDGVTWWSPRLVLNKPDRLSEPRGSDVLPSTRWVPIITFWQTTIDLFVAGSAPAGHGHNYHTEYADGWSAIAPPPGWTTQDTAVLREVVGLVESVA
ncbi:alpha/beta hydrolase [Cellulomonas uda]|uniref:Membrane protein n=1 Tax=Cellulomonas uda TaxID=1714 RepID=A0A4Y3KB44_CELUD|nr:alpha/beta-hydrolase family protein [Cellulomonas uda]NII65418.1 putative membrane protein [Cellulomonas uda]GEA80594.1 membrane protein [Cellulomonas uda]